MRITHAVLLVSASSAGCMVGEDPEADPVFDSMTLDRVENYQTLPRINAQVVASTLGPFDINCYIAGDYDTYRRIHPETSGSNVTLGVGTVIVREVLDDHGGVAKLTVMAKGPPGYDPSLGDWWFGVTDPQGVPLWDSGTEQIGRMNQCHGCHLERASDDFLFGVPAANE